jgi:hypothetical protein
VGHSPPPDLAAERDIRGTTGPFRRYPITVSGEDYPDIGPPKPPFVRIRCLENLLHPISE